VEYKNLKLKRFLHIETLPKKGRFSVKIIN